MGKSADKVRWLQFGVKIAMLVLIAGIAWGGINTELRVTKHRVNTLETAMTKLAESSTEMALDIREIKTLLKDKIEKDGD